MNTILDHIYKSPGIAIELGAILLMCIASQFSRYNPFNGSYWKERE